MIMRVCRGSLGERILSRSNIELPVLKRAIRSEEQVWELASLWRGVLGGGEGVARMKGV